MNMQARLLRRKKWYTLDDAARRLNVEFGGTLEAEDIVQFVLDDELPAAIHVEGMPGRKLELLYLEHRPHHPIFIDVRRFKTVMDSEGDELSREETGRKWQWLSGIYHLRLYDDAISGWRAWLQGFGAPSFDRPSFALSELEDSEECYTPLMIDDDADLQASVGHPGVEEWIITRADLDAFIAKMDERDDSNDQGLANDLRALEALGLLAETFAKQGAKYRKGDAGKPNCAQIAQAMSQQAGETPGMGERKLAGLLSDALDAWHDKRR